MTLCAVVSYFFQRRRCVSQSHKDSVLPGISSQSDFKGLIKYFSVCLITKLSNGRLRKTTVVHDRRVSQPVQLASVFRF